MKLIGKLVSSLFTLLSFHPSSAGIVSSGGGGAYLCENSRYAIFVDTWEAMHHPKFAGHFEIDLAEDGEVVPLVRSALRKLTVVSSAFASEMLNLFEEIYFNRTIYLPTGITLAPPGDARNVFMPAHCSLSGLALYDDGDETLYIDKSIYGLLRSNKEKAAVWVHETVYKWLRMKLPEKERDSVRTRQVTMCLISKSTPKNLCWDEQTLPRQTIFPGARKMIFCNDNKRAYYISTEALRGHFQPREKISPSSFAIAEEATEGLLYGIFIPNLYIRNFLYYDPVRIGGTRVLEIRSLGRSSLAKDIKVAPPLSIFWELNPTTEEILDPIGIHLLEVQSNQWSILKSDSAPLNPLSWQRCETL